MENINIGESFIRKGSTVAKVLDQYGEERIIYRQKGMKDLRIKNTKTTLSLVCNRLSADYTAKQIKKFRLERGLTMEQLGIASGIKGTPKCRIYEIEKNTRKDGIRMGTLYCIAEALQVEVYELIAPREKIIKEALDILK